MLGRRWFATVTLAIAMGAVAGKVGTRYQPTWESLDTRPLPQWYDDAKVGVFIHWGVYSVPSFGSEWFWYDWIAEKKEKYTNFMKRNYPPNFSYQDFAKEFTAELFDAKQWAKILKKSGAKYVVLTSKHHEGFTLWPSKYSYSWNAKDIGAHRDLVGELAAALRSNTNITFGLYHSLYEWFHPLWLSDKNNNFTTQNFVNNKIIPEMKELVLQVTTYRPDVLWSDGDWEADSKYWRSCDFLAWLYSDSPVKNTIVTNDRWGRDAQCKHGDFLNCQDRYLPDVPPAKKWENAMTVDRESWGYRREATLQDYLGLSDLLHLLARTVSLGGNLVVNVGPTKEGTIAPVLEERLLQLGDWLAVNGEAVYRTRPWTSGTANDTLSPSVYYTQSADTKTLYALVMDWPKGNLLKLGSPRLKNPNVTMLGYGALEVSINKEVQIHFPTDGDTRCKQGWALRISGLIT
ncbi:Alpha-L-fucosidase [Frankliniella fusca]|uniref:Putative alpha-L-fucosidase n=1 Tax=Frankliniella fusca TaxID=407009 RepID=A0AAE1HHV0_9NEOP|nr:Alpha-L-fucosidase [Frankliniella fusca]KAK3921647.1 Alpha-L-fucosidase [Frankliniella fusca]